MEYIHIAGTNAKGSTAQYLFEILSQKYRCGLFTSPHLLSVLERFRITGRTITQKEYEKYMERAGKAEGEHLFCQWMRAALAWFEDEKLDYAIIETGMGGGSDCTNVVDAHMQILTPISFDHMDVLGNTLTQIAQEKSGIIKYGSTVVSHPQPPEVMRVIRRTCDHMDARLVVLDEKEIRRRGRGFDGQTFDFSYGGRRYPGLHINAISPLQVDNACVAIMAAQELGVDADRIERGIAATMIPARAQALDDDMIVDGAHNVAALQELEDTIRLYYPGRKVMALVAVMGDKDVLRVTEKIAEFASFVVTTCADKKRGVGALELAGYFTNAKPIDDPRYAFEYARDYAAQKKSVLAVCGSFYLASSILDKL